MTLESLIALLQDVDTALYNGEHHSPSSHLMRRIALALRQLRSRKPSTNHEGMKNEAPSKTHSA